MSLTANTAHVAWPTIAGSGDTWVAAAIDAVTDLRSTPGVRALVLETPLDVGTNQAALHTLAVRLRACPVVVLVLMDGAYGADAVTILAAGDLAIASQRTTFALSADSPGAFDDGWLAAVPVRAAKWLAFGAGAIDAATLAAHGAINVVVPAAELHTRARAMADHVARISEDVIALKKRAHDGRARFAHV